MLYSNLPSAIYAGCVSSFPSSSSTIVSARAAQDNQGTQVHGPIIMWAQPITVQLQSSDSSLFVTTSSTASTADSSGPQPTTTTANTTTSQTVTPSQTPSSTGLSAGAKAGIGVGVGIGGVAIFVLLFLWVSRNRRNTIKDNSPAMQATVEGAQYYYHNNTEASRGFFPPAGSNSLQGPPSELGSNTTNNDNAQSTSRRHLPELQG